MTRSLNKLTTADVIARSMTAHGDRYDYSKTIYVSAKEKIVVTCPEHGDFLIRPSAHYGAQRQGCKACGGRPDISTQDFIKKSKGKFGERFDYSKTNYINTKSKVIITCPLHGDFSIVPSSHLFGAGGCKECSGRPDYDTGKFVSRLKEVYGDKYLYQKVVYRNRVTNIVVGCPKHGDFMITPANFLAGSGCPSCSKFTIDDFLRKAKEKHGELYNYSQVDYVNTKEYVTIICSRHGPFSQTPNRHLDGRGCPTCGIENNLLSNRDPQDKCIIYYLKLSYKGHFFWKVGITTHSVDVRYRLLSKDNVAIESKEELETEIGKAIQVESSIIKKFNSHLEYRGHILKNAKGGTECFKIDVLGKAGLTLKDFFKDNAH